MGQVWKLAPGFQAAATGDDERQPDGGWPQRRQIAQALESKDLPSDNSQVSF